MWINMDEVNYLEEDGIAYLVDLKGKKLVNAQELVKRNCQVKTDEDGLVVSMCVPDDLVLQGTPEGIALRTANPGASEGHKKEDKGEI